MAQLFLFSALLFFSTSFGKMASMDNATSGLSSTSYSSTISQRNTLLSRVSYSFGVLFGIAALIVLNRSRKWTRSNPIKARNFFFVGVLLFIISMALVSAPSFLFLNPSYPGNFDIRAT